MLNIGYYLIGHYNLIIQVMTISWLEFIIFLLVGESRYPLAPSCGYFDLIRLDSEHCNANSEKTMTWNKLHDLEKEKQTGRIYIDHSRAMDLCLQVHQLPRDLTESFAVKYVPIRVDVDKRNLKHPVHDCIFWQYSACGDISIIS